MKRLGLAAILIAFMYLLRQFFLNEIGGEPPPSISLGFILLASFAFAQTLAILKLPLITGYIVLGFLAGPSVMDLIPASNVGTLKLIDEIAIVIIAMLAGGEIRWMTLRRAASGYARLILVFLAVVGFGSCIAGMLYYRFGVPGIDGGWKACAAGAIVLAISACAKSPATTIALLRETKAKGPLAEWSLNVVVLLDGIAIVLFSCGVVAGRALIGVGEGMGLETLGALLGHILGAVAVGFLIGGVATAYLRSVAANHLLFILLIAIISVELCGALHLDKLILGVTTGFVVENFSRQGKRLIHALEHGGAPVFVVFFTLVGANMEVRFFGDEWLATVTAAALIGALTWLGFRYGARWGQAPESVIRYGWSGFISQAGVNLGFAYVAAESLPGIGERIKSIIVALVVVNQIVGPIMFRVGLAKAGEIGLPLGNSASSARRLEDEV